MGFLLLEDGASDILLEVGSDDRAIIIVIADAMVAAIGAASLSQTVIVERHYVPYRDVKDLATDTKPRLSIVPVSLDGPTILDRSRRKLYEYSIDAGIQRFMGRGAMTEAQIRAVCDPLMLLCQEIGDLFNTESLDGYEVASLVRFENQPIFFPLHIDEMRVFTSVLRFTFNVARQAP